VKKISVLVVEDSPTMRLLLEEIISADPRLTLMGSCESAEQAIERLATERPDIISMDILLPGIDGLEAIRRILAETPIPVVVISSTTSSAESRHAMEALQAGALTVLPKPEGPDSPNFARHCRRITDQLAAMSQVRVIRRIKPRHSNEGQSAFFQPASVATSGPSQAIRAIGIAASTGGPVALLELLAPLPATFPIPILLVQHIAVGFGESFAQWLNESLALRVCYAEHLCPLLPGHVYLAPDGKHLAVMDHRCVLLDSPPVGVHRPSATVLFESLAKEYGAAAAGIILTGMGQDGAQGLVTMRRAGAWTCGQDEESCMVFGMPQAAEQMGALSALMSLTAISNTLNRMNLCLN
jgi:two-component system, chemotaxis family, protein-glutamate methylesterase/glutaminase